MCLVLKCVYIKIFKKMETKIRKSAKPSIYFSVKQKHTIIRDYLSSGLPKQQIWQKYTGDKKEKGKLLKFMRQLGYIEGDIVKKPVSFFMDLPTTSKPQAAPVRNETSLSTNQLEQELKDSRLREQAYLVMIQIAERDLKIDIRKKSFTK